MNGIDIGHNFECINRPSSNGPRNLDFMNWKKLLFLVLAAAVAGGLYYRLRPTDEKRIRKQLAALSERLSKNAGESTTIMALKLQGLDALFAAQVEIDLKGFHGNGVYQQEELASLVARFRPGFRSMHLTFSDLVILIETADSATTTFTARLQVEDVEGKKSEDIREIKARLKKADKIWGFTRFEEVAVLER